MAKKKPTPPKKKSLDDAKKDVKAALEKMKQDSEEHKEAGNATT